MLQLSERLQQNIAFILRRSRELEEQAASPALSQPGKLTMLCYSASELALTALISSDELESLPLPREAQLLQRESASALRQIALHALDIQAWELPDAVRAELAAIRKQCETLAGCVELPPEPETPAQAPLVPAGQQAPAQAGARDLMLFTPAAGEDEETLLRAQIRALRDLLASLVQERDELVHVTCRELEARYYRELGSLEAEVFRADGLVHFYRRRAEYLRAARNRDEKPDVEKVEEKLRKDLEEFREKLFENYGITLWESRGCFSYLIPDRERPIRAGRLGTDFDKGFLLSYFRSLDREARSAESAIPKPTHGAKKTDPSIRLIVDLQSLVKACENPNYARKVKISNLKEMSKTLAFLQENQLGTEEDLRAILTDTRADLHEKHAALKATEKSLDGTNLLIRNVGQYLANKNTYSAYLKEGRKQTGFSGGSLR